MPEELAAALAASADRLGPFTPSRFRWFSETGSTNDLAAALADAGGEEGSVVAADRQTAGRGRLGRHWVSPPGAGIYMSAVLRPGPDAARLLTLAAGVAVADGIAAGSGLRTDVKWPNDVHVGGRKVAGILAEGAAAHVVVGIGINVSPAAYPPEVAVRATSIENELGRPVDRWLVLAECLAALASRYAQLQRGEGGALLAAWRERAGAMIGRTVEWTDGDTVRRGTACDIAADGALLVRASDAIVRIVSGEVRWP